VKRRKVLECRSPKNTIPTLEIWRLKRKKGKNSEAQKIGIMIEE
jgi:hypothetical protein